MRGQCIGSCRAKGGSVGWSVEIFMKKNILFAMLSTGTNYIIPLLIVPYIVSAYGLVDYGRLSLYLSFCGIVVLFSQLNLENIFPSLGISINKIVIKNIVLLKMFFFTVSYSLIVVFMLVAKIDLKPFFIMSLPLLGCVLNVNYVYVTKQHFRKILTFNVISKLFFSFVTFYSIWLKLDILIIGLLINGWYFSSSLLSFIDVLSKRDFINSNVCLDMSVLKIARKIIPGFLTTIVSLLLTLLIQPVISIISSNNYSVIGLFSIFEKIIRAVTGLLDAVNNVIYSMLVSIPEPWKKKRIIIKTMLLYFILWVFGTIFAMFFIYYSPFNIAFIDKIRSFGLGVAIASFIILVISQANILTSMVLFRERVFNEVSIIILISSLIFLLLVFLPVSLNKGVGFFLVCLLVSETISLILKGVLVWKKSLFCK